MKKQTIGLTIVILLIGLNQQAYAIDAKLHPEITRHAIAEYNRCVDAAHGTGKKLDEQAGAVIVKYTEKEDAFSLPRYRNWHFFDAYSGRPHAMKEQYSLHRIYKQRIGEFITALNEKKNDDLSEASGRILHYVQDMAVPSHVAPNYHVKIPLIANKPDLFDGYLDPKQITYTLTSEHCQKLRDQNREAGAENKTSKEAVGGFFDDLLKKLAAETRKEMEAKIPANSPSMRDKTWTEVFWPMRDPVQDALYPKGTKPGFAPYAGGDDEKRFNLTSGICAEEGNNDACRQFVESRYKAAVDASVRLLMYVTSMDK